MAHGDTLDVPAEVQEALYPLRLERMELRPDSGGAGRWRGSSGMEKHYRILAPCTLVTTVERTECPAWGVAGGEDARGATVFVERAGTAPVPLLKGQMALQPGDRVRTSTGGGGGFGPALERPADAVAQDVALGYVSPDAARASYRVAAHGRRVGG